MIRAFVALALPEPVRFDLMLLQNGLPLPRPVPAENLHLTLVFLGELPEPVVADVDLELARLRVPGFEVALTGLDVFGGPRPRAAYVGAATNPALAHLQSKVSAAARAAGVEIEGRRFVPHVTLARLKPGEVDPQRLGQALALRGGYTAPRFRAEDFRLFRSWLGQGGATYREIARYPLG
jgi:2'-5' RNA ligase